VQTAEGEGFAGRMGCLFVETSAKTAAGVIEAFNDVVARIIDMPSLWRKDMSRAGGGGGPVAPRPTASGPDMAGTAGSYRGMLICRKRKTRTRRALVCVSSAVPQPSLLLFPGVYWWGV
jgi:hypothetical protein